MGVIAFIVAASLLSQIIPSPAIPSNVVFIGPKYDHYKVHKDDYNALFFGSSRVFNQIVPEAFDAAAKKEGVPVNSYNFGVPAMRVLDSTVLLEQVLANPPENLKWVFFESVLDKGYEPIPNARTHRAMYWHNWKNTKFAARYILDSSESLPSKAVLLFSHLLPALYHQMNVGRLFNQVLLSEFSAREKYVASQFSQREGYFPLNEEDSPRRQTFLDSQDAYEARVQKLKKVTRDSDALTDPALSINKRRLLARITRVVRKAGAEPIFIEPPSLELEQDFKLAYRLGDVETLLSYKDPAQFPELYLPESRFDADHLNESASLKFTRMLAEDFSEAIQE